MIANCRSRLSQIVIDVRAQNRNLHLCDLLVQLGKVRDSLVFSSFGF